MANTVLYDTHMCSICCQTIHHSEEVNQIIRMYLNFPRLLIHTNPCIDQILIVRLGLING